MSSEALVGELLNEGVFEAWYDLADNSVDLTSLNEIHRLQSIGAWLKEPVFLHRIRAETLEAARELHQDKMDWENFWAQKDQIADCHRCGVRYFLRRTVSCPRCESIMLAE
jgi:hypothetical protein